MPGSQVCARNMFRFITHSTVRHTIVFPSLKRGAAAPIPGVTASVEIKFCPRHCSNIMREIFQTNPRDHNGAKGEGRRGEGRDLWRVGAGPRSSSQHLLFNRLKRQ